MAKDETKKSAVKKTGKKSVQSTQKKSVKSVDPKKVSVSAAETTKSKRSGLRKVLRSPFRGYFSGAWQELKEVSWPDRKTSWKLTLIVILFSVIFSAFTASLDVGFEKLAQQIFLK